MFSSKMQDYVFGLLSLICSLKGLSCIHWSMEVLDKVNGTLKENVILPCSFTHPKQNIYTGCITIKWLMNNKPIFQYRFQNKTEGQDSNCINSTSYSERFSLQGNLRKGNISLRINNVQFTDASQYTCRVELDYDTFNKHTRLTVNAPAQILSLNLDIDSGGVMVVKCIFQGNPIPQVKWTSSAGLLKPFPDKPDQKDQFISSVLFSDQDMYTCQAVNSLGQDQKTFPPDKCSCQKCSGLLAMTGILGGLLLLGIVAFILYVVKIRQRAQTVMLQDVDVQRVKPSIYQTNEIVYANISTGPVDETRQVDVYSGELRERVQMTPRAPANLPPGPTPDLHDK